MKTKDKPTSLPRPCRPPRQIHVAISGSDTNSGTSQEPLRTIQHAADMAWPGDTVIVHEGVYRERVNPPRGGSSDSLPITYQAAPGERVEIKGSERVGGWESLNADLWKVTLPAPFFGAFNPFADLLHGDWFTDKGRPHHTGAVYLNNHWLPEAASYDDLSESGDSRWFACAEGGLTTIWARFPEVDPNEQLVEVNVRQTVFYPDQPGCNYIRVRGFILSHAATPWAPPTAEQIALIGTHWSKGWIIEENTVRYSVCCGISLGKYGDQYDNTSADSAEGYVKTVERAHAHAIPWNRENIGHHIVRHNHISHCEQAGIVGSLGAAFSSIEDNVIHDIHVRRLFTGHEMAGIKFHGAIDSRIVSNHIFRTCRGIWLDWMTQGTRVSRNLLHDNLTDDLYVEVNHGPFLVDANLLLSSTSLLDVSQGGAYAHNLFAGRIVNGPDKRLTPYHPPHSTFVAGLSEVVGSGNRFFNNIFIGDGAVPEKPFFGQEEQPRCHGHGLWVYNHRESVPMAAGNVHLNGARAGAFEADAVQWKNGCWSFQEFLLTADWDPAISEALTAPVTSARLGIAEIPKSPYVTATGLPLQVDTDFFGHPFTFPSPRPGPFAAALRGPTLLGESMGPSRRF